METAAHNKISYKTYYPSSQKDNKETDSGTDKTTTNNGSDGTNHGKYYCPKGRKMRQKK